MDKNPNCNYSIWFKCGSPPATPVMTPVPELSLILFEAAPQIAHSDGQIPDGNAIPKKKADPKAIIKRKHHDWHDHATQRTTELALRTTARKWLVDNKLKDKVKPFVDSSWDNEDTVNLLLNANDVGSTHGRCRS